MKTGLVIPLFKKRQRNNLINYRGVCPLTMAPRILARVLATRLRKWAEEMNLMDDNQQGFRTGRSTADATQVLIRTHDKAQRTVEISVKQPDDPVTKAYPRVDRPIVWSILTKFGMKGKMRRALEAIHEKTEYKIRGKETDSTSWTTKKGLREECVPLNSNETGQEERRKRCEEDGTNLGIEWQYIPGHSLPPKDRRKARGNTSTKKVDGSKKSATLEKKNVWSSEETKRTQYGYAQNILGQEARCETKSKQNDEGLFCVEEEAEIEQADKESPSESCRSVCRIDGLVRCTNPTLA